ncbi:MAG: mandelate racemase/muconate lactonizing enzyme family protein [Chloroflexi bacterium]|nr:mandelate racemase/muconate lactonizing enzyme family protein [Chloroflexota bacterium]
MKITDVRVFRMGSPAHKTEGTNWLFVRIDTDFGISGWGEGSLQYKDAALEAEILDFGNFLEGKDLRRIDWIWTSLYRRVTWAGGPVSMSAISAIDLALWDLKAKMLEIPVWELAGGMHRERVRVYANGWFEGRFEPNPDADPESKEMRPSAKLYAEGALELKNAGWTALKFYPYGGPQIITPQRLRHGTDVVRAVREAVGPDMEIGIDVRARIDPWSAGRAARELEQFNIAWMEEPILYDNVEAMAEFAKSVRVPVSTGEQLYNRWEFRPLLATNTVRLIQPDICHCGGFSEIRKIASMAETHYVSVAPHNSNGPLSTFASLHFDMSVPNAFMQEIFVSFVDRYQDVLTRPIDISDGYATVPAGPGWGAEIDLDAMAKYPPVPFKQVDSEPYLLF